MPGSYDIIIIGAGHNGLVAAAYLARAGMRVLVLERRELVGGACVTEAVWPGFKVSTASYVSSLFRPEIIRDLELGRHGFELLPRSPSSFTPFPDGRFLLMGPDKDLTRRPVAQPGGEDPDAGRPRDGRGARRRHAVRGAPGRVQCGRARHVPRARGCGCAPG